MRQSVKNCACACINIKCSFALHTYFFFCSSVVCFSFLFLLLGLTLFFLLILSDFFFHARSILCYLTCTLPLSFFRFPLDTATCYITCIKYGLSKIVHVNTSIHTVTRTHAYTIITHTHTLHRNISKYIGEPMLKCLVH